MLASTYTYSGKSLGTVTFVPPTLEISIDIFRFKTTCVPREDIIAVVTISTLEILFPVISILYLLTFKKSISNSKFSSAIRSIK